MYFLNRPPKAEKQTRESRQRAPKSPAQYLRMRPTSFGRISFQETRMRTVPERRWPYSVWGAARIWAPETSLNGSSRRALRRRRPTAGSPLLEGRFGDQPKPPAGDPRRLAPLKPPRYNSAGTTPPVPELQHTTSPSHTYPITILSFDPRASRGSHAHFGK